AAAQLEAREPALPDPDVTRLRIEVQVRTVQGDPAAAVVTGQPFIPIYSATRSFPDAFDQPLHLEFAFANLHQLTTLDGAAFPDDGSPLPLPTARAIRLVLTPLGFDDPQRDYWGSEDARTGASPLSVYLQTPSTDERALWLASAQPQIEAIFLQPDLPPTSNLIFQTVPSPP